MGRGAAQLLSDAQLFSATFRCSMGFKSGFWPLKDIQRLVLKPLLHCPGCVLRVIVLLEGEPSPQSEVLSALDHVFIKDLATLP